MAVVLGSTIFLCFLAGFCHWIVHARNESRVVISDLHRQQYVCTYSIIARIESNDTPSWFMVGRLPVGQLNYY